MKFPVKQTLESFVAEQIVAYQKRIESSKNNPGFLYSLKCETSWGDTVHVCVQEDGGNDDYHLYSGECQFTGRAAADFVDVEMRMDAMKQAMKYTQTLVVALNSLGGWVPWTDL